MSSHSHGGSLGNLCPDQVWGCEVRRRDRPITLTAAAQGISSGTGWLVLAVQGNELACSKIEEPKKKLGHEFPHGQTALTVPSDNQKTMRQIDPGGQVREYGWLEGSLPVVTHAHHLWLIHKLLYCILFGLTSNHGMTRYCLARFCRGHNAFFGW